MKDFGKKGEIIVNALYGLLVVAVTAVAIAVFASFFAAKDKAYKAAIEYAEKNNCTLLSKKGAMAFVFSNGAIIGSSVILEVTE